MLLDFAPEEELIEHRATGPHWARPRGWPRAALGFRVHFGRRRRTPSTGDTGRRRYTGYHWWSGYSDYRYVLGKTGLRNRHCAARLHSSLVACQTCDQPLILSSTGRDLHRTRAAVASPAGSGGYYPRLAEHRRRAPPVARDLQPRRDPVAVDTRGRLAAVTPSGGSI